MRIGPAARDCAAVHAQVPSARMSEAESATEEERDFWNRSMGRTPAPGVNPDGEEPGGRLWPALRRCRVRVNAGMSRRVRQGSPGRNSIHKCRPKAFCDQNILAGNSGGLVEAWRSRSAARDQASRPDGSGVLCGWIRVALLDEMETAGLVIREANSSDRRLYSLQLTVAGRERMADASEQDCAGARVDAGRPSRIWLAGKTGRPPRQAGEELTAGTGNRWAVFRR